MRHAREAHEGIPGSRLEVFPEAGHFPHRDDPGHFADVLLDFVETTRPLPADPKRLRSRLRAGPRATALA